MNKKERIEFDQAKKESEQLGTADYKEVVGVSFYSKKEKENE